MISPLCVELVFKQLVGEQDVGEQDDELAWL